MVDVGVLHISENGVRKNDGVAPSYRPVRASGEGPRSGPPEPNTAGAARSGAVDRVNT